MSKAKVVYILASFWFGCGVEGLSAAAVEDRHKANSSTPPARPVCSNNSIFGRGVYHIETLYIRRPYTLRNVYKLYIVYMYTTHNFYAPDVAQVYV